MARVKLASLAAVALAACAAHAAAAPAGRDAAVRRTVTLGRSVDGRPITAVELGDPDAPFKTLVVGCIHGDECAGTAIADRLASGAPLPEADVWVLRTLNPDGAAAGTRGNAHGVDLNRNFPLRWRRLGGSYDSGPHPLSEPEARIAARLVARLRPAVAIWFHQHLGVVDDSTGDPALERRFARLVGLRVAPLAREPGSAVTWESRRVPHGSAFVVELPAGALTPAAAARYARAVRLVVRVP